MVCSLQVVSVHSLTDKTVVCGTTDPGSIPGGRTRKNGLLARSLPYNKTLFAADCLFPPEADRQPFWQSCFTEGLRSIKY